MNSSVLVSGADSSIVNGIYEYNGSANDRPTYTFFYESGQADIFYFNGNWTISADGDEYYQATSEAAFPWLATGWVVVGEDTGDPFDGVPTVTEIPATSMLGARTLAEHLRLRILGYI